MKLPSLLLLGLAFSAHAGSVISPEDAEVSPFATPAWQQLRRLPASDALVATITFSNEHYISDNEPLRHERYDFVLPGVRREANGTYTLASAGGHRVPVAAERRTFLVPSIELLPGARLNVQHRGADWSVALVSSAR